MKINLNIEIIPQLKDNYSYVVFSKEREKCIIVDPAEPQSIIDFIKKNNLKVEGILITHHHNDHTSGIKDLLKIYNVEVFSPNKKILGTSKLVKNENIINLGIFNFKVFETPGHTLDHVVYYNEKNRILFSGDTLFRLGCGRVFEGTYKQMYDSLNLINSLNNETYIYCGHEYTLNNLKFLQKIFFNNESLKIIKNRIHTQIKKTGKSIPFKLGEEKKYNPFLSLESFYYQKYMNDKKLNKIQMFTYLRDLKNNY